MPFFTCRCPVCGIRAQYSLLRSLYTFAVLFLVVVWAVPTWAAPSYDFTRGNLWGPPVDGGPDVVSRYGYKTEQEALAAAKALTPGLIDAATFNRYGPRLDSTYGRSRWYLEQPRVPTQFAQQPGSTPALSSKEEVCRQNVDQFNKNDPAGRYSFLRVDPLSDQPNNPYIGQCACWVGALNRESVCSLAQPVCPTYYEFSSPPTAQQYGFPAAYSCINIYYAVIYPRNIEPEKNVAAYCSDVVGNPISPIQGMKLQYEADFATVGILRWERRYSSALGSAHGIGEKWRHTYARWISNVASDPNTVLVNRSEGGGEFFSLQNNTWIPDADVPSRLESINDINGNRIGWLYHSASDEVETYDASGKLVSILYRTGDKVALMYSDATTPSDIAPTPGLLIKVTDQYGRSLSFKYDDQSRIIAVMGPQGNTYNYAYDLHQNLVSVRYPDSTTRTYHYENPTYPNALTGITDENNIRYSTYQYDSAGRAISTEHGGLDRYTVAYGSSSYSTVTDPLNTIRTYNFQPILGVVRSTGQSQPAGSGCAAAASNITYDANGNVSSRTDFNGTVTTYSYDLTRNLETRRIEASGTASARTISTDWQPGYRLPTRIAEPNKLTINTYDAHGNLLSRSEQATSDATGSQGFDAPLIGSARIWHYSYNDFGQVLTATDPNGHTTTYAYDSQGNLVSITNAAGQATTLSAYDANGRVGRITDANGVNTDLTYSPRGWLTSRKAGDELTHYDYDGVGQLTRVTQPDGSTISYTYDDAHRLTDIADSLGNSIHYTLDAMGNRTKEEVKDVNGTLARQTTRVYDALNRLQQVTGGI